MYDNLDEVIKDDDSSQSLIIEDQSNDKWYSKSNKIGYSIIAFSMGFAVFPMLARSQFLKDNLNIGPAEVSLFDSISTLPWMFKPLLGFMSDTVSICGYKRKVYIFICTCFVCLAYLYLAMFANTFFEAVVCQFTINLATGFISVIGQSVMVEISNEEGSANKYEENAEHADSKSMNANSQKQSAVYNISQQLGLQAVGMMVMSQLGGFLLNWISTTTIFIICSVIYLVNIISGIIIKEKSSKNLQKSDVKIKSLCRSVIDNSVLIQNSLKKRETFLPMLFILLVVISPGKGSTMFQFGSKELNFSSSDFAMMSVISQFGSIMSQFIYRNQMNSMKIKYMIILSTFLYSIATLVDLILTLGLYQNWANPLYISQCSKFFESFSQSMHLMPVMIIACSLCPKDIEATFYSFVLMMINIGYMISYNMGAQLTQELSITSTDFTNLNTLIIISATFPIMNIPFIYFLLPMDI